MLIQFSKLPWEFPHPPLQVTDEENEARRGYLFPQSKSWPTSSVLHQRTEPGPTNENYKEEAFFLQSELSKGRKGYKANGGGEIEIQV